MIAVPTSLEMAVVYIWLGSFIVLGTDATMPRVFGEVTGANLAFYSSLVWEAFPVLLMIVIGVRVLLVSAFKLTDLAKNGIRRWIEMAFSVALIAVLLGTNYDLMLRVRLSDVALRKYVADSHRLPPHMLSQSHRVGLFTVHATSMEDDVVWLETVRYGSPWAAGLVYCADGSPRQRGEDHYQHLYGPWWRWHYDI